MGKIGTAVVGCGIFGNIHVDTYSRFAASELVAVCDIDEKRAGETADKYGCRCYTSVEELAGDDDVQAVSIATPDFAHVEPCLKLAEAGKHILVEKPLAMSVADAEKIAAAVEKAGVVGMVDFHNRYNPALYSIRRKLDAGELGRAQMMFVRLSDRIEVATEWFAWASKTGPEWFLGSHIADLACWMFGDKPRRIFAEGRRDVLTARGVDCYDAMQIHLSFPSGMATLETSWILPNSWPMIVDFYVSVQGTAGRADAELTRQSLTVSDEQKFDWPLLFGDVPVGEDRFGFFSFSIHDFVRAVARGEKSPPMSVREGVDNVRIVAAAVESAETNRPVELDL